MIQFLARESLKNIAISDSGMDQEKVWDKIAPYWVQVKHRKYASIEQMYQEVLQEWKKGSLVDAGCGGGRDALLFACEGFEVTAVDFSAGMLAEVKKKIKIQNVKIVK